MQKNILYLAAVALLLTQSCTKEKLNKSTANSNNVSEAAGTSLRVNAANGYGTYQFISVADGLSAEIGGTSLVDGGESDVTAYTELAHQQWRMTAAGEGYYTIMNLGSGKFLTSYLLNGTQRLIQARADTANSGAQLWSIISVGGTQFKVINKASGLAITNTGSGKLRLMSYANNNTQFWSYRELPNMTYRDDAVVNFFHRGKVAGTTVAFDQGNSIPLSNGKVVWITQDAWDASQLQGNGFFACNGVSPYHNSALIQPDINNWNPKATPNMTTSSSPGQPLQIIASRPDAYWTWPGQGIEIDGHVYVLATEGGDGGNYFNTHDQCIYDFTMNSSGTDWGTPVRRTAPGLSGQNLQSQYIQWSCGMVDGKDGYVYVYGYYNYAPGENPFISHNSELYVARFEKSAAGVTNWTFWNGTSFLPNLTPKQMKKVGSGKEGLSLVSVANVNGKYVLLDMDYGFSCDPKKHDISLATASSPTGPFTPYTKVYTITDRYQDHLAQYYTPLIHPEFVNGKNELLITYCLNFYTECARTCTDGLDPNLYQLKAIRVPYSQVGIPKL